MSGRAMLACVLLLGTVVCDRTIGQQPAGRLEVLPQINPGQARLAQTISGLDGPGLSLAYDESSHLLAAGCESGTIHYWNGSVTLGVRAGSNTPHVLHAHRGPVTALAWQPGGFLASAGVDGKIVLWSMPEGVVTRILPLQASVRALRFSPDGRLLASAGEGSSIEIWDVAAGKPAHTLPAVDWVLALAFSPDGKRLAAGGYEASIHVYELSSARKILDLPVQPPPPSKTTPQERNAVLALAFSPDGRQLAIGGTDGQVHLAGSSDGKIVRSLAGHEGSVSCLIFHGSGNLLVSASKDHTIRLWNPANGQALKILQDHTSWVEGLALVAEQTRLASVAADRTVRLWDLK